LPETSKQSVTEEQSVTEGLPVVLRTAFADGEVYSSSGAKIPLDSNVSPEEALTLYTAVREIKPAVSAEVGFAKGVSTLSILQGLEDNHQGSHHVIDPFQKDYGYAGLEMAKRAGTDSRLTFYETFPENVIPGLPRLQFAFIDASHLYDLTLMEFVLLDKKLDVGGLIGLHDMWMPSLQKALRYILSNRSYRLYPPSGQELAPSIKPGFKRVIKHRAAALLAKMPRSEKIFSPELLRPWSRMQIPNLVLLEKTGEDNRDWRFHERF